MSQPDDGEYLPPTKKARNDSDNSTLITEIGECKTDPGLHKCAYYYIQTVFYKDGEVAQRLEFRKYLNEDVSMYDSVEVFLPGYLPIVRELRENDYKFDQRRQLYKHTIDLRGVVPCQRSAQILNVLFSNAVVPTIGLFPSELGNS